MSDFLPYTSQIDARTADENLPMSNPNTFGANIGEATQKLAGDMINAGDMLGEAAAKKKREEAANQIAQSDFTPTFNALQNSHDPSTDPTQNTFSDAVKTSYRDFVAQQADKIKDPAARKEFTDEMSKHTDNWSASASNYEYAANAEYNKSEANIGLTTLNNRIQQNPTQYDALISQGKDVIMARPGMSVALKQAMSQNWAFQATKGRFEGLMSQVKTVADIDKISNELVNADGKGPDWQSRMEPKDYHDVVEMLGNSRKTFGTAANTTARAYLDTLEQRTKDTTSLIDSKDLEDAQNAVKTATDPLLQVKMARIMRDQEIIRQGQRLPPAELRAQINSANGNPGLAYPGLPPEVSGYVNEASQKFGLNVDWLGGTVMREYGGYLKSKPADLTKFAPQPAHVGLDLRNMRSDVVQAAQQAGQEMGRPLLLTKGDVGGGAPGSVDVVTAGMTDADKAKLTKSLVDGGFTGFAEYDGYLRANIQQAVPQNFGREDNGKVWGGWTYLSKPVVDTLKAQGFAAGADSSIVKRNAPVDNSGQINYGMETQVKGKDGKPTSSAVGIMQFTKGTWLQVMKDPNVQAAIGIDLSKKTDAEILELRKDPRISILGGAAYAAQNKKTLETALGRPISDPEIYMAHFMGPGGATTFLSAYKNQPEQSAADLLPETADSNPNVFYIDGDPNKPRTVSQVYNNISQSFVSSPSHVAFGDNETRKRMLDVTENELKIDPISHASRVGSHTITPLSDDGGFAARGPVAKSVADYNNIAYQDMKPFTQDEAGWIKKQLDDGNADQQLGVMASVAQMGPDMAKAGMKQIEEKDAVFGHAGALFLDGQAATASDIIRGRKMITEDKAFSEQLGANDKAINDAFVAATSGALYNVDPATRMAIKDSTVAYWAAHTAARGRSITALDDKAFGEALQYTLGGDKDHKALQDVNGSLTLMPRGLTGDNFEQAFQKMQIDDYIKMSADGKPPRYVDGKVIEPKDVAGEVMMQAIGGGVYRLVMDDGSALTTGEKTFDGRSKDYLFKPDLRTINEIASRPSTVPFGPGRFTPPSIYGGKGQ